MFKNAVLLSILIHSAILLPISGESIRPYLQRNKGIIQVEYIRVAELPPGQANKAKAAAKPEMKIHSRPVSAAVKSTIGRDGDRAGEIAIKQAKIRSTKEYADYYQLIREKIWRKIQSKYRNYHNEGDVCLVFILNSDGSLVNVTTNSRLSTHDRALTNIAVQSLNEAAPFLPFPKVFTLPQLSFTVTVSFKKE